jgi:hypothetical protein
MHSPNSDSELEIKFERNCRYCEGSIALSASVCKICGKSQNSFINWINVCAQLATVASAIVAIGLLVFSFLQLHEASATLEIAGRAERTAQLNESNTKQAAGRVSQLEKEGEIDRRKLSELLSAAQAESAQLKAHNQILGILSRRARNRELTAAERQTVTKSMKVFAGQKFAIITETNDYDRGSEQMIFSGTLRTLLLSAGWVEDQKISGGLIYSRVSDAGVVIGVAPDSQGMRAARRLSNALTGVEIQNRVGVYSDARYGILIWVGSH